LHGLSVADTLQFYNDDVYRQLGFYDVWELNKQILLQKSQELGLEFEDEFESWQ